MRQLTNQNFNEVLTFLNEKTNNLFKNYTVSVNDAVFTYKLKTQGGTESVTFVYVDENNIVHIAGNILEHAPASGIPVKNEVEEFAWILDYFITELLNKVSATLQVEYLTKLGLYEQYGEKYEQDSLFNSTGEGVA